MLTVVVGIVVLVFIAVAAFVDWRGRRRGSTPDPARYGAHVAERRRDLRVRRSMMNLGAHRGDDRRR